MGVKMNYSNEPKQEARASWPRECNRAHSSCPMQVDFDELGGLSASAGPRWRRRELGAEWRWHGPASELN